MKNDKRADKRVQLMSCIAALLCGAAMALHDEWGNVFVWSIVAMFNGLVWRYAK